MRLNKPCLVSAICLVVVVALLPGLSLAGPFHNGSFENGLNPPTNSYSSLYAGNTNIDGWVVAAGRIDWSGTLYNPKDGHLSAQLVSDGSAISQTFDTVAGDNYQVSFSLQPWGTVTTPVTVNVNIGSSTYNAVIPVGPGNTWYNYSFVMPASTTSSTLAFSNVNAGAVNPAIDDVSISTAATNIPPSISTQPTSETNMLGSSVNFSVQAFGSGLLAYQWQHGSTNLVDNARTTGSTSNFLSITGVVTNDVGNYQVVITNASGSITSSPALLSISIGILLQPTNQNTDLGANASFQVSAVGTPPLTYQWLRFNTNLTDDARITGSQSNYLTVSSVQFNDVGNYQVLVHSASASLASAVAILRVNQKPTILVQPQSQVVPLGASDAMTIIAAGPPEPNYQWRLNGTNLANNARITGSQSNTMAFANLLATDVGNYDVVVANSYGSITSAVAVVSLSNQATPPTNVAPSVIWAREGGGPIPQWSDSDNINTSASDGKGGVYVAGHFNTYARFGSLELNGAGTSPSFFLVKYDAAGNPVWEKHGIDGGANSEISKLAGTPDGGVVVVGDGGAPVTIDGQFIDVDTNQTWTGICPTCANSFAFLTKFDAEGRRLWFHAIYGGRGAQVTVDPSGNVAALLTAGSSYYNVHAAVDVDGQIYQGSQNLGGGLDHTCFLVKYDASGQLQSVKEVIEWSYPPYSVDLFDSDVDGEGNLYITGRFLASGGLGFYTYTLNIGSVSLSVTDPDDKGADLWFAAKLDANGEGIWLKQIGSGSHPGYELKVDGSGEVYLTGAVGDTADKNELIKLDAYGHVLWQRGYVNGAMACDAAGNVVMAGGYFASDFSQLTGQAVADPFGTGIGIGLLGFSPSGNVRFSHYYSEPNGAGFANVGVWALVQDSPNSWLMAGSFLVSGALDEFQLQTPWPGRDTEDFVARLAIPATNDLPIITVPPKDTTVFETRPLQMAVSAASVSPLNYQWRFNNQPLANATSNALSFASAGTNLTGIYSVTVSNANGGLVSASATVTVLPLSKLGEVLNATNLQWKLGGQRSWQLDTNVNHDTALSLRTDYLLAGVVPVQDCWIETTVQGPGVLNFWWKASIQLNNIYCGCDDGFQFRLDGVQQFEIFGDVDWQPKSVPIASGTHTVRWYWSEPTAPGNLNLCWVDQVSFQTAAAAAPMITDVTLLTDGKFQFTLHSSAGATLGIEACSDLKSWLPIGQVVATNGIAIFLHSAAINYQQHYYRAVRISP